MPEWLKGPASKAGVCLMVDREFKSHSLRSIFRQMKYLPILCVLCVFCASAVNPLFSHADDTTDIIASAVKGEYQKAIKDTQCILGKLLSGKRGFAGRGRMFQRYLKSKPVIRRSISRISQITLCNRGPGKQTQQYQYGSE